MSSSLLLPTTVVGAHGRPSWVFAADDWIKRGLFGPTDLREFYDDSVDRAIADQENAGVDIITDGEMRRRGFVETFGGRLTGLENVGPDRKVGEVSIDMEPILETRSKLNVPHGLGIVEEFNYLKAHTSRALKVTVPGPFALTSFIRPVEYYRDRTELALAFVPTVNAEIRELAAAGADFIQVDEPATPGVGTDAHDPNDVVALFNACVEGVSGVKFAIHICFGTYRKISYAKRSYAPYFPCLLDAHADQFVLEFANREMSEVERWPEWGADRELGAGVIDVRNHYLETPEDVAERLRVCLKYVAPEKLHVNPDCGLRRVPRWLARKKLEAMVQGTNIVRNEIAAE